MSKDADACDGMNVVCIDRLARIETRLEGISKDLTEMRDEDKQRALELSKSRQATAKLQGKVAASGAMGGGLAVALIEVIRWLLHKGGS